MKLKEKIRDKFRNDVFERDGYKCVMCGRSDVKLDAHHIINRNDPRVKDGGYTLSNGVSLCDDSFSGCHYKAEMGLITEKYLLDLIDIMCIKEEYKRGESRKNLSKKYNVSISLIDKIINGDVWRHLEKSERL